MTGGAVVHLDLVGLACACLAAAVLAVSEPTLYELLHVATKDANAGH